MSYFGVGFAVFSRAVEYSLRAMVMLTEIKDQPLTVQAMAERGQIPAPYLSKLLQGLTRAGLISSQRGTGGGYFLARSSAEISLADIVKVIEPLQRLSKQLTGTPVFKSPLLIDQKLEQTLSQVKMVFEKISLADLRKESNGSIPLCSPQQFVNLKFPEDKRGRSS
jgi:Rrf2 family transcriptional regulator, nitric oxide-sensitive transcriptional repressor